MRALFQKDFVALVGVKIRFSTWQKLLTVYFMQNDLNRETAKFSMNAVINWMLETGIKEYSNTLEPGELLSWDAAKVLADDYTSDPAAVRGIWEIE